MTWHYPGVDLLVPIEVDLGKDMQEVNLGDWLIGWSNSWTPSSFLDLLYDVYKLLELNVVNLPVPENRNILFQQKSWLIHVNGENNEDYDDNDENDDAVARRPPGVEQNVRWSIGFSLAQLPQPANGRQPFKCTLKFKLNSFAGHCLLLITLAISTSPSSDLSMLSYKPWQETQYAAQCWWSRNLYILRVDAIRVLISVVTTTLYSFHLSSAAFCFKGF